MAFNLNSVYWGSSDEIGIKVKERAAGSFTISSATVTVTDSAGSAVVTAGTCTVDSTNQYVYYVDTFNAAGGYTEGSAYTATFKVTITGGYVKKWEGTFTVLSTADE